MPHSPGGRTHRILARLAQGPAGHVALMAATRLPTERSAKAKDRLRNTLKHLLSEGYARDDGRSFLITPAGELLLGELDAQQFGRPSIRIFANKEHA